MKRRSIVVVSGLPRSGTSMMMKMLEAGGIEPLTDRLRRPDADNPKGYYEFERVKQLAHDKDWLDDAEGRAVKVISQLLKHLPAERDYYVIFMRRNMAEILSSQHRMLERRGEDPDAIPDEKLATLFRHHLKGIEAWLNEQANFRVLYVNYNRALKSPGETAERIDGFLDIQMDVPRMAQVVDPSLYRQRT